MIENFEIFSCFLFDFPSFVEDWLSWGEKWFALLGVYLKLISVSAVTTMTIVVTRYKSLPRHLPAFCVKPPNSLSSNGRVCRPNAPAQRVHKDRSSKTSNRDYPQGGDGGSRGRTVTLACGRSAWRMPFFSENSPRYTKKFVTRITGSGRAASVNEKPLRVLFIWMLVTKNKYCQCIIT